jgi:hypothetical protein
LRRRARPVTLAELEITLQGKLAKMKLPSPQFYALQLKPLAAYEVSLEGASRTGFHRPLSLVCPKLYVVTRDREIHYVGVTNRPMAARINMGLRAEGKGGYHGYGWKGLKARLRLIVWSFPEGTREPFLRELETVEAEFAFLVRKRTGQWPLSQTEIHFHHASSAHCKAAEEMMKQCAT